MNIDKLVQIVGYILAKYDYKLNYTKLIKLLYLADRTALIESGMSITGDKFVSMDNGPVLSTLYDLIKGRAPSSMQTLWNLRFLKDGYRLVALSDRIPNGELSQWEMEILDKVDSQYHSKAYGEMIDIVHDKDVCPEWENPNNSSKPIDIETILRKAGWSEDDVSFWSEENKIYEEEDKLIASLV